MKVLGIGESVIDHITFQTNDASLCAQTEKHVGGPVLAAMILLARLGIEVTFISTIGRDQDAEIIKRLLKHEGVRLLPKYQQHTKVNTILVDKQTGKREKLRGEIVHKPLHAIDKKFLQDYDAVLFDRHEITAFREVIAKKAAHTQVIIDPSTEVSKNTLDMVRYADCPVIPVEFVAKVDSDLRRGLETLYKISQKPIIVTAGDMGSLIFDGKALEVIPAKKIRAVDATGAGDIYRGAYAYGVLQQWSTKEAALFANLVAGLQCSKVGNAAAIPTNAEILLQACRMESKEEVTMPKVDAYFQTLL